MINGYVIKLITLKIYETLDFVCVDLLLTITPLMLMLLLHSKIFLRTYVFFDTVHLIKNIQNNLLNAKKFVFLNFLPIKG